MHNLPKMDFYCIKPNFAANHDSEPHLIFEDMASIGSKTDFVIWMTFYDLLSPTCANLCFVLEEKSEVSMKNMVVISLFLMKIIIKIYSLYTNIYLYFVF